MGRGKFLWYSLQEKGLLPTFLLFWYEDPSCPDLLERQNSIVRYLCWETKASWDLLGNLSVLRLWLFIYFLVLCSAGGKQKALSWSLCVCEGLGRTPFLCVGDPGGHTATSITSLWFHGMWGLGYFSFSSLCSFWWLQAHMLGHHASSRRAWGCQKALPPQNSQTCASLAGDAKAAK